jgi:hypothetical protein
MSNNFTNGGYLQEKANEIIWGWLYDAASAFATESVKLITDFVLMDTDIDRYMQIGEYVRMMQVIAWGLITIAALWEIVKQISDILPTEEKSLSTIFARTGFAVFLTFFLPWSIENLFIRLNNLLIKMIQYYGVTVKPGMKTPLDLLFAPKNVTEVLVIMVGIIAVAGIFLGVMAGIRYVEIIISTIISPICAVSAVNQGEALNIWVRETVAIVFTQSLHIFLLQFLLITVGKLGGIMDYVIAIGIISAMIKGPHTLRKYVYSVGAGSSSVRAAGAGGRMAAMKIAMKSARPV